jgi:hypothetical protein
LLSKPLVPPPPAGQYQGRALTCDEMRVLDQMRCLERQGKPYTLVVHYNGRTTHVLEGVPRRVVSSRG